MKPIIKPFIIKTNARSLVAKNEVEKFTVELNNVLGYTPLKVEILMNDQAFLTFQSKNFLTFYLLNHLDKSVEGQLSIFVDGETATTALKAPFGFFEMGRFREKGMILILDKVEEFCVSQGVTKLIIRCLPDFYNLYANRGKKTLKKLGFSQIESLQNYYIEVDKYDFEVKIAPTQLGRIRKAVREGFNAFVSNHGRLKEIYEFIYLCRSERNYSGLVGLEELETLLKLYPTKYLLFLVVDKQGTITAANISVKIRKDILYTWYTHHLNSYSSYSPIILLHKCIYDFCRDNEIKFIDLSVAKDGDGREKISLQRFKKRIGGVPSTRSIFEKKIDE